MSASVNIKVNSVITGNGEKPHGYESQRAGANNRAPSDEEQEDLHVYSGNIMLPQTDSEDDDDFAISNDADAPLIRGPGRGIINLNTNTYIH